MGRIYSGNPLKDTELASESIIDSCILVENPRNKRVASAKISVSDQLKSDKQIEPPFERTTTDRN